MRHIRREKGKPSISHPRAVWKWKANFITDGTGGGLRKGEWIRGPFDKSVTCHDVAGLLDPHPAAPYLWHPHLCRCQTWPPQNSLFVYVNSWGEKEGGLCYLLVSTIYSLPVWSSGRFLVQRAQLGCPTGKQLRYKRQISPGMSKRLQTWRNHINSKID